MSANDRLNTIKGHLSGNYPQGLLAGEVAIITGSGYVYCYLSKGCIFTHSMYHFIDKVLVEAVLKCSLVKVLWLLSLTSMLVMIVYLFYLVWEFLLQDQLNNINYYYSQIQSSRC